MLQRAPQAPPTPFACPNVPLSRTQTRIPGAAHLPTRRFADDSEPTLVSASTDRLAERVARPGRRIGRWIVERELGRGGMGYVVLARDSRARWRCAAVKVSRWTCLGAAARLHAEAEALARVRSPYVVRLLDTGATAGRAWLAMEYVPGPTLREFAPCHHDPTPIVDALVDAGQGLVAAHEAGVLHRDVKSSNIVVGDDGRARIVDFGLALCGGREPTSVMPEHDTPIDDAATHVRLTEIGCTMGTPAYMAPEQHLGRPLDPRCDQFGFAVTAFESLLAARPFAGPTPDAYLEQKIAGRIRELGPSPSRPLGQRCVGAILRGLAAAPAGRWPELSAMMSELAA